MAVLTLPSHPTHTRFGFSLQGRSFKFEWPLSGFAFPSDDAKRDGEVAVPLNPHAAELVIARLAPDCAMPNARILLRFHRQKLLQEFLKHFNKLCESPCD